MKKGGTVLLRVHPDLLQTRADFLGEYLGVIGLDDPTIATQQVEQEPIRNGGAVGNTAALDPGDAPRCEAVAEFGKEPGLANAGFTDNADRLATAVFNLL